MSGKLNKAKKFYLTTEKSSLQVQDPISIVKTMVKELQSSMNKVSEVGDVVYAIVYKV